MYLITAKITIEIPFRTCVKEGESYSPIEKNLEKGGKIKIYPFEHIKPSATAESDHYVNSFRKVTIEITLPLESDQIDIKTRQNQKPFFELADEYLNLFLLHCKTKSNQYWWQPIYFGMHGVSTFFYSVKWTNENNDLLHEEKGSVGKEGGLGCGINKEVWDLITDNISKDIEPSIVDFHMDEARYALFSKNVKIWVINTAIALEVYISQFCTKFARKIGKDSDVAFECLISNREDGFIIKYFKKIIPYLSSKNLKKEHNDKYLHLDYLFRTRNSIVHYGNSSYKDDSGKEHNVGYEEAHKFFLNALDVMEWIRLIDSDVAEQLKCFIEIK